jgi:hypothetical protein
MLCTARCAVLACRYARRGFRVAVPGFPGRCGIDSSIFLRPFKELQVRRLVCKAELQRESQEVTV